MRRWLKRREFDRVVVTTTDNHALDGLLVTVANDGLVLHDATVRSDNDVRLAGEVYVPRERVRFVQVLAGT